MQLVVMFLNWASTLVLLMLPAVIILYNAPAPAAAAAAAAPAPAPAAAKRSSAPAAAAAAPAPPPSAADDIFENVTQSLVFAGDYSTFIELLVESNVDVKFQSLANDTSTKGPGITIFAPRDDAFKSIAKNQLVSLQNLTALQKVRLVEYHALNDYQAFKDLQNSNNNVTSTFASLNGGGHDRFQINITFTGGGRLEIASGWTTAKISTTIYSKKPVSIFAIDQVLLPDEIFGLPPAPPGPPTIPSPPSLLAPSSASPRISTTSGCLFFALFLIFLASL